MSELNAGSVQQAEKLFSRDQIPMNSAHLETTSHQNARLVPAEPKVKSSKTRELFNRGVSGNPKTGKSADPTC